MSLRRRAFRPGPTCRQERGFSLPEVLVAALILLIVAIGIVPLFVTAISHNSYGEESTRVTALGRASLEEMLRLNFQHDLLDVPDGTQARFSEQSWNRSEHRWEDDAGASSAASALKWTRRVRVQQFSINDARDIDGDGVVDIIDGLEDVTGPDGRPDGYLDNPVTGGPLDEQFVHLKTIEVEIMGPRLSITGGRVAGREFDLSTFKTF